MYPLEKFFIYFSPYTAHAIEVDGVLYPTVEHAYQCERYTDPKIIEEIRRERKNGANLQRKWFYEIVLWFYSLYNFI